MTNYRNFKYFYKLNLPVSYWRIIWLPWSPVCKALKSTWICMLSPIASRPLSGVTKNGSCTNSWNFALLLPMFRTRRVLVVAYWEDKTITWSVVPRNLDVLANFLCNEYQSITNTAHICIHKVGNNEHATKIVLSQFWIFKQQSSHLSNLWISLFNTPTAMGNSIKYIHATPKCTVACCQSDK